MNYICVKVYHVLMFRTFNLFQCFTISARSTLIVPKNYVQRPQVYAIRQMADVTQPEKLSLLKRFKQMYRDYWYVLIPVHLVTSSVWAGMFYYMAVMGVDVVPILEKIGISERFTNRLKNSKMGYFAVAYGFYKLATPLRYMVTLGGTTIAINYLKRMGYIKPAKHIIGQTKKRMKINAEKIIKDFKAEKN